MSKILNYSQKFIDNLNDEEFLRLLNEMRIQYTKKPIGVKVNRKYLLQYKLQFECNPNDEIRKFYTVPMVIDNTIENYEFIYKEKQK